MFVDRSYRTALFLAVTLCSGCAGVDREHSVAPGYEYRPWKVDRALDSLCPIPAAADAGVDDPAQRGLRLMRAALVDTAIFHYGVSRIERYSDNRQADSVALLTSADQALDKLAQAWASRKEPHLYEVRKADIVNATASMAARALEPTSDQIRRYYLSPNNLDVASDLIVGAIQVALYEKAYANDCNRLMHWYAEEPGEARLEAIGLAVAGQLGAVCKRGHALTGLEESKLCDKADAQAIFK